MFIIFWTICAITTAIIASAKGRSGPAWLALGFIFGIGALIAILCMGPVDDRNA